MKDIIESITNLHRQLEKHPDVRTIYRQLSDRELNHYYSLFDSEFEKSYIQTVDAFSHNIEILIQIEIEKNEENKNTVDVIEAVQAIQISIGNRLTNSYFEFKTSNEKMLLLETAAMLVVFCVNCQITRKISALLDDNLEFKSETSEDSIFRGHTNSSYKLIPSIYRNLSIEDGFGIVNDSKLSSLYSKSNLSEKYKRVFGDSKIDYNFCAFAQHSKAYSPFLDFTEDYRVALSFATGITGPVNEYIKKDAFCIFSGL